MDATREPVRAATGGEPVPRAVRAGAYAGLIGPVLYLAAWLVQAAVRRDEFDLIAEPGSGLATGSAGWIQTANFVVFGVLTLVFAVGLHRAIAPARAGWLGPALIGVSAIGLLWAAAFPLEREATGALVDPGVHGIGGTLYFLVGSLGIIALVPRLRKDARWRRLVPVTVVVGALTLLINVLVIACYLPEDGPLRPVGGLIQLVVMIGLRFPWQLAVSTRMLRLAHA
ncbi:hypothetical protein ARHIZOSPH14_29740 [Agromyces rhizosphaerae]|uniref:DUF998 domain-containing protein n=1 Tax=Agromyces rhizosphaerae TaxID=88374 RepID=A0A9W6D0T6_9MICO|nr:DUF998 domain-containing protein [Agromyces rhizosphaerae]GLI28732.1 hypothetical protein ARHIZOSPH14_29740 [Agromyces rhizosphaerae]